MIACLTLLAQTSACVQPEPSEVSRGTTETPKTEPTSQSMEDVEGDREEPATLSQGVLLKVTVEVTPQQRVVLSGETNLPDGTIIMTSVSDRSTDFLGQERVTVNQGRFRSSSFGPAGGLPPGIYTAGATMPIPRVQTPEVRSIIGDDGENLVGPLVERGKLGTTVSIEERFQIGSDAEVARQGERRKQAVSEATAILRGLRELEKAGRSMEVLRDPNNLERLRRCGEEMRRNQATVQNLEKRADALPRSLGLHLAIAASSMDLCVSCLHDATESCDIAASSFADAERAISEE